MWTSKLIILDGFTPLRWSRVDEMTNYPYRVKTWSPTYNKFMMNDNTDSLQKLGTVYSLNGVLATTIMQHLFAASLHGRPLDLQRIADEVSPPTLGVYRHLRHCEKIQQLDVTSVCFKIDFQIQSIFKKEVRPWYFYENTKYF